MMMERMTAEELAEIKSSVLKVKTAPTQTILRLVEQAGRVEGLEKALDSLLFDGSPLWQWVNEKGIGRAEWLRRDALVCNLQSALRAEPASQLDAPAPPEVAAHAWKPLMDSHWVNIVNHAHCYENFEKEDAVHLAVRMTEAKLKELNASPAVPVAAGQNNTAKVEEIRELLGEAYSFHSTSPRAQSNINAALDLLDEIGKPVAAGLPASDLLTGHLEAIAATWDGNFVDSVGETIDVGDALRSQFKHMVSALAAAPVLPVEVPSQPQDQSGCDSALHAEPASQRCISRLATRPILYTDIVNGVQACRDDLWAVTTEELNVLTSGSAASGNTNLTRYDLILGSMVEKSLGDYVKFSDLQSSPIAEPDTATQGEHAAFEAWIKSTPEWDGECDNFNRRRDGKYCDMRWRNAFEAWEARASLAATLTEDVIVNIFNRTHNSQFHGGSQFDGILRFARAIESHLKGE